MFPNCFCFCALRNAFLLANYKDILYIFEQY